MFGSNSDICDNAENKLRGIKLDLPTSEEVDQRHSLNAFNSKVKVCGKSIVRRAESVDSGVNCENEP